MSARKRRAGTDEVSLADDLVEGARPQAGCKGCSRGQTLLRGLREEVVPGHRVPQSVVATTARPSSASTPGSIGAGASVIGSQPDWVFGKAMTSRMLSSPGEHRHEPVEADREAGVWRRAVPEGAEQEAEARRSASSSRDPEDLEDPLLDVGPMDTDAPRAELPAVEDQVVGLAAHRRRVGAEPVEVVGMGHGERVVGGDRAAVRRRPRRRAGSRPPRGTGSGPSPTGRPAEIEAELAEHRAGQAALVGDHQHEVAGTGAGPRHQPGALVVGEEPVERRVELG